MDEHISSDSTSFDVVGEPSIKQPSEQNAIEVSVLAEFR